MDKWYVFPTPAADPGSILILTGQVIKLSGGSIA